MCAIAGGVSTGTPDPGVVRAMCDAMVHRGPDGDGFHEDEHAALGMRRLAIVDVAGGAQPVYNEDRSVVAVFNGELYNYAELRTRLLARGHRLTGGGDSECLVHLYEEYGEELVHRLRGMFAFAIWDRRAGRLLLARDRLGKKPLYWRTDQRAGGESLWFGSELKALLTDPGFAAEVDPVALHHYLTFKYVPAPWSILRGVAKLPPGHVLSWQGGQARLRRYWRYDPAPRLYGGEEQAAERLRELLLEATKVRLTGERPIGAFLSGGVDSSAVVAAMAQCTGTVKTFSIGFEDKRFDERTYARMVAERYGTDHQEFVVRPSALEALPQLAAQFDEPFGDASAVPSFYVAKLGAEQVTVVLNGDGGDECFGGYQRYALLAGADRLPVPGALRPRLTSVGERLVARSAARTWPRRIGRVAELLGSPTSTRYARMMSTFSHEQKIALYTRELAAELAARNSHTLLGDLHAESRADSELGRIMDVDVNSYLPGDLLVKADTTTMAHSLEARSPLLDHHLVEWAAGLPASLKVRRGRTKYLFKQAVRPWLPGAVVDRPKMGFGVPLADWLRGDLRELAWDTLTAHRGFFHQGAIETLLRAHDAGTDHSKRLWSLLQFELWYQAHLKDRAVKVG
jgi:asparagine synthase (glutamine-hydrolysing)